MTRPPENRSAGTGSAPRPGRSLEMFRDLCENAQDLVQSVSPEGRLIYVNRAWCEVLGHAADEAAGRDVFEFIHPDSVEHCRAAFGAMLRGEPRREVEFAFRARDGRRVEVAGSARCWFERGRPVATSGIFREVTAEKRLRHERERLFELSLDLLCVAGTDGFFKQVNPAFERVLGYRSEELLRRSFLDFVHPDDVPATVAEVERLAAGQPVVDFKNRYRTRDGSLRWLAWRAAPLPGTDLVYAVARDITEERRVAERMARQAEALARSNADLEQFVSAASHDLRAPLRAIGRLADWIEADLPEDAPAGVREHLARLRQRAQRMDALIEDLLRYHRAIGEAVAPERVDTAALVRDLAALLAPPAGFEVVAAPGLPVLETARAPLELALRNLIGNAVKHHDRPGGTVTVSARRRDGVHEFTVADDGPGVPAEHHERIFGLFQQLRPRDEVEGTGMGLALVRRTVELQGGRIRVESGPGRGAAFHFTWPERPPAGGGTDDPDPDR